MMLSIACRFHFARGLNWDCEIMDNYSYICYKVEMVESRRGTSRVSQLAEMGGSVGQVSFGSASEQENKRTPLAQTDRQKDPFG
jgi:hypothetical protein